MKTLTLTNRDAEWTVIVGDSDEGLFSLGSWRVTCAKAPRVVRCLPRRPGRRSQPTEYLVRAIMRPGEGQEVGFRRPPEDRVIDCRRSNLLLGTHIEVAHEQRAGPDPKRRGISFNKAARKWRATVRTGNVYRHLGSFRTAEQAAQAAADARREAWGSS